MTGRERAEKVLQEKGCAGFQEAVKAFADEVIIPAFLVVYLEETSSPPVAEVQKVLGKEQAVALAFYRKRQSGIVKTAPEVSDEQWPGTVRLKWLRYADVQFGVAEEKVVAIQCLVRPKPAPTTKPSTAKTN
jgi:hypothetical protein